MAGNAIGALRSILPSAALRIAVLSLATLLAACSGDGGGTPAATAIAAPASATATPARAASAPTATPASATPASATPASATPAPARPPRLGILRLTDSDDSDGNPAWSPDGRKIAFVSDRDGDEDIYVMDAANGSNVERLTYFGAEDEDRIEGGIRIRLGGGGLPVWSPDGQRIAFAWDRWEGNLDIYVMDADGSNVERLTDSGALDGPPAWSPDGQRIAFGSRPSPSRQAAALSDGGGGIFAMNADGSGVERLTPERLTPDPGVVRDEPAWSPDGRRIAFTSVRSGNYEIYVMDADGSNVERLTDSSAAPVWSPDGQRIAFVAYRDGGWGIFAMNADGSGVERLTESGADHGPPVWSPDGRRIAFTSERSGNYEIYVMDADGSNVERLTDSGAHSPVWSPDGQRLAFVSEAREADIHVVEWLHASAAADEAAACFPTDHIDRATAATFRVRTASGGGGAAFHIGNGEWLTSHHAVQDATQAELAHGGTRLSAVVEGSLPGYDLALLRAQPPDAAPPLRFAAARAGAAAGVAAIGFPPGVPAVPSATRGAVSHHASFSVFPDVLDGDGVVLRTDIGIRPGNSGGPIVDDCGAVVGIATFQQFVDGGIGVAAETVVARLARLRSAAHVPRLLRRLTYSGGYDGAPAWSPGGQRIAFVRGDGIYAMNADGSGAVRLTTGRYDHEPAWSPDGRRIAFVRGDDIHAMNADGSGVVRLTRSGDDNSPAWSPDGRRIAFVREDGIHVMNADGSGVERLTSSGDDNGPAWSPDGRRIAFSAWLDIHVMNADGSGLRRLTGVYSDNPAPAWSPDGQRIALTSLRGVHSENHEIYVMNADGSNVERLTDSEGYDRGPARERQPASWRPRIASRQLRAGSGVSRQARAGGAQRPQAR